MNPELVKTLPQDGKNRKSSGGFELKKHWRKIGSGAYGAVSRVDVLAGKHKLPLAIKEFFHGPIGLFDAESSFKKYILAKKAKTKVLPTYRLVEGTNKVVMTLLDAEDTVCVSTNNTGTRSVKDYGLRKIEKLPDLENLIQRLITHAIEVAKSNVVLPVDSYLFVLDRHTLSRADFWIADTDEIESNNANADYWNLINAWFALEAFLKNNMKRSERTKTIEVARRIYEGKIQESSIPNKRRVLTYVLGEPDGRSR